MLIVWRWIKTSKPYKSRKGGAQLCIRLWSSRSHKNWGKAWVKIPYNMISLHAVQGQIKTSKNGVHNCASDCEAVEATKMGVKSGVTMSYMILVHVVWGQIKTSKPCKTKGEGAQMSTHQLGSSRSHKSWGKVWD